MDEALKALEGKVEAGNLLTDFSIFKIMSYYNKIFNKLLTVDLA